MAKIGRIVKYSIKRGKMRRFDYDDNNEEHREDVDGFFGDMNDEDDEEEYFISPEEYKELVEDQQAMQQLHINLAHRDLDDRLLFKTIRMLEKSFWWRFYSQNKKLRLISRTYKTLKRLNERD